MSTNGHAGYAEPVSLPISGATPEMLADLVAALRGRVVNGIRIHDVQAYTDVTYDSEPVVRVRLLLDDPVPGERTWPGDTLGTMNHLALSEGWRLGIPDWVFASLVRLSNAERGGFPLLLGGPRIATR